MASGERQLAWWTRSPPCNTHKGGEDESVTPGPGPHMEAATSNFIQASHPGGKGAAPEGQVRGHEGPQQHAPLLLGGCLVGPTEAGTPERQFCV